MESFLGVIGIILTVHWPLQDPVTAHALSASEQGHAWPAQAIGKMLMPCRAGHSQAWSAWYGSGQSWTHACAIFHWMLCQNWLEACCLYAGLAIGMLHLLKMMFSRAPEASHKAMLSAGVAGREVARIELSKQSCRPVGLWSCRGNQVCQGHCRVLVQQPHILVSCADKERIDKAVGTV